MYTLEQVVIDILNARLADEYAAERFYIAASIWCDLNGYELASKHFVNEYHDERRHAHKLQKHASDWGIAISLPTVSEPQPDFESLGAIVMQAYEMEHKLGEAYANDIKKIDEDYPATEVFLSKFIKIQDVAVVGYANMLKKMKGISEGFELKMMEKKIF